MTTSPMPAVVVLGLVVEAGRGFGEVEPPPLEGGELVWCTTLTHVIATTINPKPQPM